MKKIILTALLVAGFAGAASAQTASGDIVLGFRDTANAGAGNLMIKLGDSNSLVAGALSNGGSFVVTNLLNSSAYSTNTISGVYGSGWSTNATLKWATVGMVSNTDNTNGNGVRDTLFGTKLANTSLLDGVAVTSGYTAGSATTQSNASIIPMYSANWQNFGTSTDFSLYKTTGTTLTGSWSKQGVPTSGSNFFVFFPNGATVLENTTNITSSYVASDLWKVSPTGVAGSTGVSFLGTVAIFGNGDVTFTAAAAAIPEPSTYAAILGAAVLGFVMLRRRNQLALV